MNERIEKYSKQCLIEKYDEFGNLIEFGFDEQKFAELIIQENAAELRRLYAINQELLEVLKAILNDGLHCAVAPYLHRNALAAIAKATGETT